MSAGAAAAVLDPNPCPGAGDCYRCEYARRHPGHPDCRGNALAEPVPFAAPIDFEPSEEDLEWAGRMAARQGISVEEMWRRAEERVAALESERDARGALS